MRYIKYAILTSVLCLAAYLVRWFVSDSVDVSRRMPTIPTITQLPPFPEVPSHLSDKNKHQLLRELCDHKLSTYPESTSIAYRAGKLRSTGFSIFDPTEDQIRTVALHYDLFLLAGFRSDFVLLMRKQNPLLKVLMYFDSGLVSDVSLTDAGNVDDQNTQWIFANHPEWLLRDSAGDLIRTRGGPARDGQYWPDPGNEDWQVFFAEKLNKALARSGNVWDGVLLDQFLVRHTSHHNYARAAQQVNYDSDEAFQSAQLRFLERVTSLVGVPIIPNVEGQHIPAYPRFFAQIVDIAGGAEGEVFAMDTAASHGYRDEKDTKACLDLIQQVPTDKIIMLNTPTAGIAGDVDRTLYAYFTFLLVAGRDRQVYWTFKEGTSSVPHYWYKEFDLDLGAPSEEMQAVNGIWKRDFANAVVAVNPTQSEQQLAVDAIYYDVLGRPLTSPVRLRQHTGLLLVRDRSILPK